MFDHYGKIQNIYYITLSILFPMLLSFRLDNYPPKHFLVILNKYDEEFRTPTQEGTTLNYFQLEWVEQIIEMFHSQCQRGLVVYSRHKAKYIHGMAPDLQKSYDIIDNKTQRTDYDVLRGKPSTLLLQDIILSHLPSVSANEAQMRIFSESRCFITTQGGLMKLAGYFGGTQIVWHIEGRETSANFGFYFRTMPRLSGQHVVVYSHKKHLFSAISKLFSGGCGACRRRRIRHKEKIPTPIRTSMSIRNYCSTLPKRDIRTGSNDKKNIYRGVWMGSNLEITNCIYTLFMWKSYSYN